MTKPDLRRQILSRLRRQPSETRLRKSLRIGQRLRGLAVYRRARRILCYVAVDGEVETRPILAQALLDGKQVAVPVAIPHRKRIFPARIQDSARDLTRRGAFGIPEPENAAGRRIALNRIDLVIVPGVAFDRRGRRLGRGGGYFDRFLARIPSSVPRVGLAFQFQRVKSIPWEPHDQPVSRVITERS